MKVREFETGVLTLGGGLAGANAALGRPRATNCAQPESLSRVALITP
jgi:hypothetical protein